jgi:hypothetical protein
MKLHDVLLKVMAKKIIWHIRTQVRLPPLLAQTVKTLLTDR